MSNNPLLHYKPGLTMDEPVTVTMAAADWAILMAWFGNLDAETERGVSHIVYGVMSEQISAALYSAASIQAAKAHYHENEAQRMPNIQIMGQAFPVRSPFPRAEDVESVAEMRCAACGRVAGMPTAPCLLCPDYGM